MAIVILAQVAAFDFNQTRYDSSSSQTVNPSSNGGSKTGKTNSTVRVAGLIVSALVNYGNTTSNWYNYTNVRSGWNFYNLTVFLANGNVNSTYDQTFQEHFVLAINGVRQNSTFYWSLWKFCRNSEAWTYSQVGADDIQLTSGDVLSWYFTSTSSNGAPVPGARVAASCN